MFRVQGTKLRRRSVSSASAKFTAAIMLPSLKKMLLRMHMTSIWMRLLRSCKQWIPPPAPHADLMGRSFLKKDEDASKEPDPTVASSPIGPRRTTKS